MSAEAMDAHFAETGAKLPRRRRAPGRKDRSSTSTSTVGSWPAHVDAEARRGVPEAAGLRPALLSAGHAPSGRWMARKRRKVPGRLPTNRRARLIAANYYGRFRELTLQGGLRGTHPESGGPGVCCWIDALQCEGINDIPWASSGTGTPEPAGSISCRRSRTGREAGGLRRRTSTASRSARPRHIPRSAATGFDDPWTMKGHRRRGVLPRPYPQRALLLGPPAAAGRQAGLFSGHTWARTLIQIHLVEHERRVADVPGRLPAPAASGALCRPISPISRARTFRLHRPARQAASDAPRRIRLPTCSTPKCS